MISVTEFDEIHQNETSFLSNECIPWSVDKPTIETAGVVLAVIPVSALVEKSVPDKRLVDVVLVLLETLVDVTC